MVLYAATLKIKAEPPQSALEGLKSFIARLEEMTLAAGQVSSLLEFRKSMAEYGIRDYAAEVPYTAWTDVLVAARTLAEKNRQNDLARQFATKELFVVYGQLETLDDFCRQAKNYGRDQKSRILSQIALKLKQSKWFGVSC
jgi:hypothetical protein